MRFLILDAEYPEFMRWLYARHPDLPGQPYDAQIRFRSENLYGMADFYSRNLVALGHEAQDVLVNNEVLQRTWAREHGVRAEASRRWRFRLRRGVVPWVDRVEDRRWQYTILGAQIRHFKPDVLLNMMMGFVPASFLREMKPHVRVTVGWGSPIVEAYGQAPAAYREAYDLVLAPSEGMADRFRQQGLTVELLRHAFDPGVLSRIEPAPGRTIPVAFVGQLRGYTGRRERLEALCRRLGDDMCIWAPLFDGLPAESAIRGRYQGLAWGKDLYRILSMSKITWNGQHEIAGSSADNMRLFEATGTGSCLLTDWKDNLPRIFEVGREVLAYRTTDECVELARYYLDHDAEREAIARAGQQRILRDHTYRHRAQELVEIVRRHA